MLDYQNQILNLEDLPKFETVDGHPVDLAYLKVLRILYAFWAIVLFTAFFVTDYFVKIPNPFYLIGLCVLVLIFVLNIIEIEIGFSRRKFGIRTLDLIFQKGFFVFTQTIVPYKRIQHVEIRQGLVFKAFDLYTLKAYTAGSSTGDLSIAGLNKNDADKLKAQILKVADLDEN